jgi:phosphotransferase system  glucose/maltose/N-acetylglucosamine-specific IIC component
MRGLALYKLSNRFFPLSDLPEAVRLFPCINHSSLVCAAIAFVLANHVGYVLPNIQNALTYQ